MKTLAEIEAEITRIRAEADANHSRFLVEGPTTEIVARANFLAGRIGALAWLMDAEPLALSA